MFGQIIIYPSLRSSKVVVWQRRTTRSVAETCVVGKNPVDFPLRTTLPADLSESDLLCPTSFNVVIRSTGIPPLPLLVSRCLTTC